jgi:hypothetical protein
MMQREDYAADDTMALSLALGWFSIALGLAELAAPRRLARLIGAPPGESTTTLLRSYGARELATGLGILAEPREARWLWSRLAGDAVDLGSLGRACGRHDADRARLTLATIAVAGVAALDAFAARRIARSAESSAVLDLSDEQAVTIKAPLETVEAAWVEWCATERANLGGNYAIRFEPAPGARGTEVRLAGGGSKGTIREELRRFKQFLEAGEVAASDGPGLWRKAQPARALSDVQNFPEVRR